MFQLFKDCLNLIEIDFSNLEGSNLENLNSAFENCDNLELADLTLINGEKIYTMNNLFNGCQKLKYVDLTGFKPKQNVSMQNTFKNCASLNYVDLSNFHSYNFSGIFTGCNNLLKNIISSQNSNIQDLKDLHNILKVDKEECQIGQGPKCKSCMKGKDSRYCEDCNEGYYIPFKKKREECIKCEEICSKCFGLIIFNFCYKCKEGFILLNGKCELNKLLNTNEIIEQTKDDEEKEENENTNKNKEIEEDEKRCIIGLNEKCKSCDSINPEFCSSCNDGYFLPENDKTKCSECSMKGCRICPNDICINCFDEYNKDDINYPNLSEEEAINKIMNDNHLGNTYVNGIYASHFGENLSNNLRIVRHYVWNKYKKKMIEINGLIHIDYGYSYISEYDENYDTYGCSGEQFNN